MSNSANDNPRFETNSTKRRWMVIGGLVFLPLLLGIALYYYWVDWNSARVGLREDDQLKLYGVFMKDIEADRLESAYQLTTADFRKRTSQEAFNERARYLCSFNDAPGALGIQSGASGPAGGNFSGPNRMEFTHTIEDGEGKELKMTVKVIHEDSFFHRRRPPPQIDGFMIEIVNAAPPAKR